MHNIKIGFIYGIINKEQNIFLRNYWEGGQVSFLVGNIKDEKNSVYLVDNIFKKILGYESIKKEACMSLFTKVLPALEKKISLTKNNTYIKIDQNVLEKWLRNLMNKKSI